jgi:hypothetical protein
MTYLVNIFSQPSRHLLESILDGILFMSMMATWHMPCAHASQAAPESDHLVDALRYDWRIDHLSQPSLWSTNAKLYSAEPVT